MFKVGDKVYCPYLGMDGVVTNVVCSGPDDIYPIRVQFGDDISDFYTKEGYWTALSKTARLRLLDEIDDLIKSFEPAY